MVGQDEFVSQLKAAQETGVSRGMIQRWIESGKLRVYQRVGGKTPLVRLSDVQQLAAIVPVDELKKADDGEGGA